MLANVLVHSLIHKSEPGCEPAFVQCCFTFWVRILVLILNHILNHTLNESPFDHFERACVRHTVLTFNGPLY